MSASLLQADLITDDPRCESPQGIMEDIREFVRASKECNGLLTVGQASKILDVGSNQISVWAARGRIKSRVVLGVRMVSAGEVVALRRERAEGVVPVGGRGNKAASLADMVAEAWKDIDPLK
jgi:hypothetical protein